MPAPERDLAGLAERFRGLGEGAPLLARTEPHAYQVGDAEEFYVFELAGEPRIRTATATLRHVTEHAYFFVEGGAAVSESTLERIGADFEELVYPTVTSAFGPVPNPGVDSDPRITLLHANLSGAGGYFSRSDAYPRSVMPFSNEREILYIDAGMLASPGTPYNALVAHELQHMVHANVDASEDSWVNEGLSQVAAQMVGGGSDWNSTFLANPDTGLIEWAELGSSAVHYAASELFFSYLLDRFGGREQVGDLVAEPADSIEGVQRYLDGFDVRFEDAFSDWVIANYLDEESGPHSHPRLDTSITTLEEIAPGEGSGDVSQFGTDYLVAEGGEFSFEGAEQASLGIPHASAPLYWSNRGDDIDTHMTRLLDLTGVDSATLTFDAWYEIERGWDYAYVAVSTDGARTWETLATSTTADYDPAGQAYGPGYTGSSAGWIGETVDLSEYAGSEMLLRFEYVTDQSTHGTGFAVDNIEVAEISFRDDGAGEGWAAAGFRRVQGALEQEWIVQVIDTQTREVARLALDGGGGSVALGGRSVIAVSAVTEGTTERATYRWRLQR